MKSGSNFKDFFGRSICRKPIIEINGLKIIQAFLEEQLEGRKGRGRGREGGSLRRDQTQQRERVELAGGGEGRCSGTE